MNAIVTRIPSAVTGVAVDTSKKIVSPVEKAPVDLAGVKGGNGEPSKNAVIKVAEKMGILRKTPAVKKVDKPATKTPAKKAPAPKVKASPLPTPATAKSATTSVIHRLEKKRGGRTPIYDQPMGTVSFKATEAQRVAFRRAGGNVYLRKQLDGLIAFYASEDAKAKGAKK